MVAFGELLAEIRRTAMIEDITKQDILHMLETLHACEGVLRELESDERTPRQIWGEGRLSWRQWVMRGPYSCELFPHYGSYLKAFRATYEEALDVLVIEYLVCQTMTWKEYLALWTPHA